MENKINIAELLKDCPTGMELDCSIWDNVVFDHIDTTSNYPIYIKKMGGELEYLTEDGHFNFDCDAKCVIFPKGKTTWEGFVPPCEFNDGDVVVSKFGDIHLLRTGDSSYCAYRIYWTGATKFDNTITTSVEVARLATEEEKKKLFDAIKENGYRWSPETKTLEKLPKFNAGDKVKRKDADYTHIVTIAKLDDDYYDYVNEDGQCGVIHISAQDDWELVSDIKPKFKVGDKIKHKDNGIYCTLGEYSEGISAYRTNIGLSLTYKDLEDWELAPNKFDITTLKSFDKVLVRRNENNKWRGSFFSHMDEDLYYHCYKYVTIAGKSYPMCIPCEGNEHLLNKTEDCNEFYKNW